MDIGTALNYSDRALNVRELAPFVRTTIHWINV